MAKNEKKYHHGDLKSALITAGLDLLEEVGLENLSLRAIAARVGVSHTAPKNHFASFDDLLAAMATEGFRRHAASMREDVEAAALGRERLDAASAGYVRFARRHPELFELMFSPRLTKSDHPELMAAADGSYAVLRDIAKGLEWPRRTSTESAELEALRTEMMLWVFVHGYASLANEGRMPRGPDGEPLLDVLDVMPAFGYARQK